MKRVIAVLSAAFLLILCTASSISFNVLVPAPISLPQHIRSIALIDRTVPEKKGINIIEGVLTGEGIGQDKNAAQVALDGVLSVMQNSQRFTVVRTAESLKGSSIGDNFPSPLPWDMIIGLCKKYEVDAILSLESFDSDFIVTNETSTVAETNGNGETVNVPRHVARGVASVNLGFRIYDPYQKSIIDEYRFSHNRDWQHSGNSVNDAVRTLIGKNEAVNNVSYNSGVMYAKRITPTWYRVTRTYYRRAKHDPDLAEGARMMEINDWDGAIAALQNAVRNGRHRKVKRRAAHNLAVVYEILGDFEKARSWAQDAYAKYGNKPSKYYLYDLNRRIRDEEILKEQLDN